MQETQIQSLGQEDPLEKEIATHFSILAWEIPWTEDPGGYSPWDHKRVEPHGLLAVRLLCPWDFPGKNIGVGCHFLLHGIFPTQGSNLHLQHWQKDSLPLSHQGNPAQLSAGND